jgi:hypothetical protein
MKPTRKPKTKTILAGLLLLVLTLSACLPAAPANNLPDTGAVQTQVGQVVSAQLTQAAGATAVAQLTQIAGKPIKEGVLVQQPTPTATLAPIKTDEPDTEPVKAPASPTPQPCDQAQFVADETVADGTQFKPGARFTKTWRLKNTGTCTWTRDYALVFASGDRMDGAKAVMLDERVRPGETVDVSVDLIAPEDPGEYTGRWMLRNADGKLFGLGKSHDKPFWVNVRVVKPAKMVWDLEEDFCLANWSTGALNGLACPDLSENTEIGFINRHPSPVLENGRHENEAALVTYPNAGQGGFIQGQFPAYKVKEGDHFRALIGCLEASKGCKVSFQLSYRNQNGRVKTLGAWGEKYDEKIQKIDVDLSELAGKEIELILTVFSKDDNTNDRAFWLRPSLWR